MPPGHDPMPDACTSVPRSGQRGQSGEDDVEEHGAVHEQVERVIAASSPPRADLRRRRPAGSVRCVRVTILGGGGFRVPLIARQLAASGLPVSRVVLYDTDPGRLAVIAGVLARRPRAGRATAGTAALPVTAVTELDAALRGADVIFCALRPGGLNGRVSDERAALARGVLGQETVGAGGLASAARTVPVVDAIARRIAALAPDAWVISMTNPAGIVTEVMAAALGPRVIGVCDSPVGLIRRACAASGRRPWAVPRRGDGPGRRRLPRHQPPGLAAGAAGGRRRPAARRCCATRGGCGDRGGAAVRRGPAVRRSARSRTSTCTGTTRTTRRCATCWPPGGPAASTCGSGSRRSTPPRPRLWPAARPGRRGGAVAGGERRAQPQLLRGAAHRRSARASGTRPTWRRAGTSRSRSPWRRRSAAGRPPG